MVIWRRTFRAHAYVFQRDVFFLLHVCSLHVCKLRNLLRCETYHISCLFSSQLAPVPCRDRSLLCTSMSCSWNPSKRHKAMLPQAAGMMTTPKAAGISAVDGGAPAATARRRDKSSKMDDRTRRSSAPPDASKWLGLDDAMTSAK